MYKVKLTFQDGENTFWIITTPSWTPRIIDTMYEECIKLIEISIVAPEE